MGIRLIRGHEPATPPHAHSSVPEYGVIVAKQIYGLLAREDQCAWDRTTEEYEARAPLEVGYQDGSEGRVPKSAAGRDDST